MCGIFGFLGDRALSSSPSSILRAAGGTIQHRGPDHYGQWFDEKSGVGLAHTRLAIVDLSPAGHQPMASSCERYMMTFNGEIYNHLDLRRELEAQGASPRWRGHSDTETLLACFSVWGLLRTLKATVGMFALAVWDKQEQQLTLARDRLGEKPLYFGWCSGIMLFGSELKALTCHPAFNADVSRGALALLLRHNYIPAPHTIYEGIEKLPAGHFVQIRKHQTRAQVQTRSYWQLADHVSYGSAYPLECSDSDAVELLEKTISLSVAGQMLADVPLGAFLSGGVDSSTVVALMQRQSTRRVKTFAIGFDEEGYNEAQYAKEVARHLGTEHTELYVTSRDALELVPDLPNFYCEPFADSSQMPTFLVGKLARQHVAVALSGDGGDELFGGYNPYRFAPRIWGYLSRLPLPLRQLTAGFLSGWPLTDKLSKLRAVLPAKSKESFYQILMSHWSQPNRVVKGADVLPTFMSSPTEWPVTDSFESWMMAIDTAQYMTDDILVKVDRAAMANSLETRVPLLDHRVVELAWRLPLNMKIRGGIGKWALREVLYRHVPRELIERPKSGFSVPLGNWLRGPLKNWAEALLEERRLEQEGYFYTAPVRNMWLDHLNGRRDHSTRLWSVLMFQAWLEKQ
ncbi:asparagine synthase (glutamine-hydrolyzing) [Hydrocarboniclastica marina]|uniref:asparagine synthase (glutamine-hydrolyzing) n=1 Tax=Hydrocarboniclastica marina TaxID=2259620 RepID=A0A4P7XIA9_9ALTE|nr:asparagine synthase (glutamine-hydrolyzing) [Hydrocarboniclastica marina]MAM00602.1 asparagine synthase (glutamine-hydrolyzing) [Alteromonadaceae bacterium]QCF26465.1 asparagine synthase (glutamine-hydrolyzing) [Hydrocarboniclastica marina]|tara:strand:+ start:9425 stop:11308 length:1884 start_codon:yes stop_codon:yes gene_type:complete